MMKLLSAEVVVRAPREQVFAFLSRLANHWTLADRWIEVLSLDAFGLETAREGFGAGGALLGYLQSLKKSDLPQIRELRRLREGSPLVVDEVTLRNLEVFESSAGPAGTLLNLLDRTETAMGARALRALLRTPARDRAVIEARLDRTACFASAATLRAEARDRLHRFPDLERTLGLLGSGRATPRDLGVLRDALRRLPAIRLMLEARPGAVLEGWLAGLPDLSDLAGRLEVAVRDSTRFSTLVQDRIRAEATRDTLLRQVNIIKSIDEDRYIW